jgi:hypothetical protein
MTSFLLMVFQVFVGGLAETCLLNPARTTTEPRLRKPAGRSAGRDALPVRRIIAPALRFAAGTRVATPLGP